MKTKEERPKYLHLAGVKTCRDCTYCKFSRDGESLICRHTEGRETIGPPDTKEIPEWCPLKEKPCQLCKHQNSFMLCSHPDRLNPRIGINLKQQCKGYAPRTIKKPKLVRKPRTRTPPIRIEKPIQLTIGYQDIFIFGIGPMAVRLNYWEAQEIIDALREHEYKVAQDKYRITEHTPPEREEKLLTLREEEQKMGETTDPETISAVAIYPLARAHRVKWKVETALWSYDDYIKKGLTPKGPQTDTHKIEAESIEEKKMRQAMETLAQ